MGHSAGAYNAAMLALDPRWLAATGHAPAELAGWVGLAGPYDFLPTDNPDAQPVFFHPNYPLHAQPIFEQFTKGAYPGADYACARQICPPVSARMTTEDARYVIESIAQLIPAGVPA